MGRLPCSQCRIVWEGAGKEPPCERCFPGVHKYNHTAVIIYRACDGQYLTAGAEATGLDLLAVNTAMDWYKIPRNDRPDVWEKVRAISSAMIQACLIDAENKRNAEKIKKRA